MQNISITITRFSNCPNLGHVSDVGPGSAQSASSNAMPVKSYLRCKTRIRWKSWSMPTDVSGRKNSVKRLPIGSLQAAQAEAVIKTVAGYHGKKSPDQSDYRRRIPLDNSWFAGQLPPVVTSPTFAIRKKRLPFLRSINMSKTACCPPDIVMSSNKPCTITATSW